MFLKLSSVSGGVTFGIGVTYSVTHCLGYIPDTVIALKMLAVGQASSGANSLFSLDGISPGTLHDLMLLFFEIFENLIFFN